MQLHNGQTVGADLKFTGVANQRRGRADVCSKVTVHVYSCYVYTDNYTGK